MNNAKIYLFSAVAFAVLFFCIVIIALPFWERKTNLQLLEEAIKNIEGKTNDLATFAQTSFNNELSKEQIIKGIQTSIAGTDSKSDYVMAVDWSGTIIAHPDITQVGSQTDSETVELASMESAYNASQLCDMRVRNVSIPVFLQPVNGTDIMLVGYINMSLKQELFQNMLENTRLLLAFIGLSSLLFVLGMLRYVSGLYEIEITRRTAIMEDGVINLEKLNNSLEDYQNRLASVEDRTSIDTKPKVNANDKEFEKSRLLTYVRNELLPVLMEDIAYVYVENTITYIVQRSGKKSTTTESLDQIFSYLDENTFFRANRQIIVAITSIERIVKYGKSQLKIEVNPPSEIDMTIGKNKAAAFKQWLDL
ncbi:MAG: LytTR family DNA-binding domain-containing protein [Bacteroidota bacterium]